MEGEKGQIVLNELVFAAGLNWQREENVVTRTSWATGGEVMTN